MSETQKGGNLCDQVKIQKAKAKEKASQREREREILTIFFCPRDDFRRSASSLALEKSKSEFLSSTTNFELLFFFFFFSTFVNHENEIVEFGGVNILGAAYGNIKLNKWFFFFFGE